LITLIFSNRIVKLVKLNAENLRYALNAIEEHLVCGYADGGDKPDKQLKLAPGAIKDTARCYFLFQIITRLLHE
jgi:hypothetical protein